MNETPLLFGLHPRVLRRWRAFPIIGGHVDDFVHWLDNRSYSVRTVSQYLIVLPRAMRLLRRNGVASFEQLTLQAVENVYHHYRSRNQYFSRAVGCLLSFLTERKIVPEGCRTPPSPSDVECDDFGQYLRVERGLAEATILMHTHRLDRFLKFLGFDKDQLCLRRLGLKRIEGFLHEAAKTNSRLSMQSVVATVRSFVRRKHAQGILPQPLHLQIDTPKSYRLERLPKAIPWSQIQALLGSIDRSDAWGLMDFSLLFLAAAYGLRSCEVVALTFDDIDWHLRTLRIYQSKTQQALHLHLTDEAATVLIAYLKKARPQSRDRHLFLRRQAPGGPLAPYMVADALERRIRLSGLKLSATGAHVLRHSFAVHLLRQGVGEKAIGDTLGHRSLDSTFVYLRLNLEDLRSVPAPLPTSPAITPARKSHAVNYLPCHRASPFTRRLSKDFRSNLASSLRRFVRLKHTLGRRYRCEAAMLGRWDDFLNRQYPRAQRVRSDMFLAWTHELDHLTPNVRRMYQRVARSFLLFHAREHPGTFIPDALSFPKLAPPPSPRLVSEAEMACILDAARELLPSNDNRLRAQTFRLGLILLFCCGLRRNELLRLTMNHVDLGQSLLHVENTKFHKSRLVPFSPTVAHEITLYLHERTRMKISTAPCAFFLANGIHGDKAYADHTLLTVWHQLCLSTDLLDGQGRPPRLHDLRHSFAVNTLQRWYKEGANVQAKLPHLATFLGHVSAVSTHYYLNLTPELRQAASQRFHHRFAPLFTNGGIA